MAKLLGATRAFISVLYSLRLYAMQTTEKHFWSAAIFAWHHLISRSADQARSGDEQVFAQREEKQSARIRREPRLHLVGLSTLCNTMIS